MQMFKRIAAVLALVSLVACANDGHAPGGSAIDFPQVTKSVSGSSFLGNSVAARAITGKNLAANNCPSCGGNGSELMLAYGLASIFVLQGSIADNNSCAIAAMEKSGSVAGLSTGKTVYFDNGDVTIRANVTVSGGVVTDFKVNHCYNGVQVQHMSGTNSGGNVTFKFRSKDTGYFVSMDATGVLSGDTWTSKTVDAKFFSVSQSSLSSFTMVQGADYLDITGSNDFSTIGTVDMNDTRFVTRFQLLGNSAKTYAVGDGSSKFQMGSGTGAVNNWNGDTGVHGAGPTTYDASVTSATLPAMPSAYPTNFTTDETWDCQMTDTPYNLMQLAMANATLYADMMTCNEEFQ